MNNSNDKTSFLSQVVPTSLQLDGTRAHLTVGPCNKDVVRGLVDGVHRFTIQQLPDCWVVMKFIAGGDCDAVLGIENKDVSRSPGGESIQSLTLWHQPAVGTKSKACERPAKIISLTTVAASHESNIREDYDLHHVFKFTRAEVEHLDIKRFLQTFGSDPLHCPAIPADVRGKTTFLFEGYEADPRELWEIPEVRRFCQTWWKAWPYVLFFADLGNKALLLILMCCMESVRDERRDGDLFGHVYFQLAEMRMWVNPASVYLRALDHQAGYSEHDSAARLQAVVAYFTTTSLVVPPT